MNGFGDFSSPVFLAPMAGITDQPMRRMVYAKSGRKVNIVSEMVAINALSRKNSKTYRIADVRDEEYPVITQLVGNNPALFADAAKLAADLGACAIDLNMGCPVRKITAGGAGSALMKDMPTAQAIIRAVCSATRLKVSVKFRKGWDQASANAVDFAKMCEDSGASYLTVHGRTRAQGYSGRADWEIIAAVKQAVKIPVVGNGDVCTPQDARRMLDLTGADGVMIGRAALGAPWLPGQIYDYLQTGKTPQDISTEEIRQTVLSHIQLLKDYYGEKLAVALSRKYICWYSKNFYDAKRFREHYMKVDNFETAVAEIKQYFSNSEKEQ